MKYCDSGIGLVYEERCVFLNKAAEYGAGDALEWISEELNTEPKIKR